MNTVKISDITLREAERLFSTGLGFKEKLEMVKLLERLNVDVIELSPITEAKADSVLLRTMATTIGKSTLCVPVSLDREEIDRVWASLSKAKRPRLNITVPTSTVQMEYSFHMKPAKLVELVTELVGYASSICPEVEFSAVDATRSDKEFLKSVISAAVAAGAGSVAICDTAGEMLPDEFGVFVNEIKASAGSAELAIQCSDKLGLAAANVLACLNFGVTHLKLTFSSSSEFLSLGQLIPVLLARSDALKLEFHLNTGEWQRICHQLAALTGANHSGRSAFGTSVGAATEKEAESEELHTDSDRLTVRRRIAAMGYDVSDEDMDHIFYLFRELASKKKVDNRDLEAIVAESAHQVPPTYKLENYVINSGNTITASACISVMHDEVLLQTISIGDGPIDAAFRAIEQAVGHHFELEDFQIRAVTEGREALGDALVKLRSTGGRLYSGRGLSTDIIGASIRAYLSAVNKIVYEERNI